MKERLKLIGLIVGDLVWRGFGILLFIVGGAAGGVVGAAAAPKKKPVRQ